MPQNGQGSEEARKKAEAVAAEKARRKANEFMAEGLNAPNVMPERAPDIIDSARAAAALESALSASVQPRREWVEQYAQHLRQTEWYRKIRVGDLPKMMEDKAPTFPVERFREDAVRMRRDLDAWYRQHDTFSGMPVVDYLTKVRDLTRQVETGQAISKDAAQFLHRKVALRDFAGTWFNKAKEPLPPIGTGILNISQIRDFEDLGAVQSLRWPLTEYFNKLMEKERLWKIENDRWETRNKEREEERKKHPDLPPLDPATRPIVKIDDFSLPTVSEQLLRKISAVEWHADGADMKAVVQLNGINDPVPMLEKLRQEHLPSLRSDIRDDARQKLKKEIFLTVSRSDFDKVISPAVNSVFMALKVEKEKEMDAIVERFYSSPLQKGQAAKVRAVMDYLKRQEGEGQDFVIVSDTVNGKKQERLVVSAAVHDLLESKDVPKRLGLVFTRIDGFYTIPLAAGQLRAVSAKLKGLGLREGKNEKNPGDFWVESDKDQPYLIMPEAAYRQHIVPVITRIEQHQTTIEMLAEALKAATPARAVINGDRPGTAIAKPAAEQGARPPR